MFAAFIETGLLAPVEIELKISERQSFMLKDMLTVSHAALAGLDGATLQALNQAGFPGPGLSCPVVDGQSQPYDHAEDGARRVRRGVRLRVSRA